MRETLRSRWLGLKLRSRIDGARAQAVEELSNQRDDWSFKALLRALDDSRGAVRQAAASALGTRGQSQAIPQLLASLSDAWCFHEALGALTALGVPKPAMVDSLIPLLSNESVAVRVGSAERLGESDDRRAIQPLLIALRCQRLDAESRSAAGAMICALGRLKAAEAFDDLVGMLGHEEYSSVSRWQTEAVRTAAARALADVGDGRAVDHLLREMLRPSKRSVSHLSAFVHALDRLSAPSQAVIDRCVQMLAAPWPDGEAAAQELDRLGWQPREHLHSVHYFIAKRDSESIVRLGPIAIPCLLEQLASEARHMRDFAEANLTALGISNDERIEGYIRAFERSGRSAQEASAIALYKLVGVSAAGSRLTIEMLEYVRRWLSPTVDVEDESLGGYDHSYGYAAWIPGCRKEPNPEWEEVESAMRKLALGANAPRENPVSSVTTRNESP